jgi:hypothetical protein
MHADAGVAHSFGTVGLSRGHVEADPAGDQQPGDHHQGLRRVARQEKDRAVWTDPILEHGAATAVDPGQHGGNDHGKDEHPEGLGQED